MEVAEIVMSGCLAVLAGIDLKRKQVPVCPVALLGIAGVGFRIWNETGIWELFLGTVPGILLLVLSVCSRESIGIGDGLVLLVLGIFCGISTAVAVLGMALVLAAVLAMVLLTTGKAGRKTELPFIPCLCGSYLLCVLW